MWHKYKNIDREFAARMQHLSKKQIERLFANLLSFAK
jgi:hypothetical protein